MRPGGEHSVQVLELKAILLAIEESDDWPLNLVVDLQYAASIVQRIHRSLLSQPNNPALQACVLRVWKLLEQRRHPIWCTHLRSHMGLPGRMAAGNSVIDKAVSAAMSLQKLTPVQLAHKSHAFFHQSARALQKEFGIPRTQARAVIAACPDCARICPI